MDPLPAESYRGEGICVQTVCSCGVQAEKQGAKVWGENRKTNQVQPQGVLKTQLWGQAYTG